VPDLLYSVIAYGASFRAECKTRYQRHPSVSKDCDDRLICIDSTVPTDSRFQPILFSSGLCSSHATVVAQGSILLKLSSSIGTRISFAWSKNPHKHASFAHHDAHESHSAKAKETSYSGSRVNHS